MNDGFVIESICNSRNFITILALDIILFHGFLLLYFDANPSFNR